jgi:hypothetical protein
MGKPRAAALPAWHERDGGHFALERWIERHDVRFDGPGAELRSVPAPLDEIDDSVQQESLLLFELVDGVLHDREGLREFLIGVLQSGDIGGHVRGFSGNLLAADYAREVSRHSIPLN